MFWVKRKKEREERAEAERALEEARQQAARRKARTNSERGLFERIAEIRRDNHIAEAVGRLMEGRH